MKLISLNVGLFEKNNEKLEAFLAAEKPDIICFQEVTKRIDSSANSDFISKDAVDAATSQLTSHFFAPIWALSQFEEFNFHGKGHFVFDLGGRVEFGNYVRSKYPILKGQNIFVQNHFSYITDWSNWPTEDYRAVEVIDLDLKTTKLRLLNYHGIWTKDKQGNELAKQACQKIYDLAMEVTYPSIICGDFNLFPTTESIAIFKANFTNLVDTYDIKTTRPASNELSHEKRNVVDYILVSKGVIVQKFSVIDNDVSDHFPLILEFEI
jgi:endonuclease/exonuclease/phosphatase family metal-dependent hydrolase